MALLRGTRPTLLALAAWAGLAHLACTHRNGDDATSPVPTAQAPWSAPLPVGQVSGFESQFPVLVGNGAGQAALFWTGKGQDNRGSSLHPMYVKRLYVSRYQNGGWGTPTILSEGLGYGDEPGRVNAAMDPQGNILLLGAAPGDTLHTLRYDTTSGQWLSTTLPYPLEAQVRFSADGTAMALWVDYPSGTPGPARLLASRFNSGSWSAAGVVYQSPASTSETVDQWVLAANGSGHALAAWSINRHTSASRFSGTWEAPVLLSSDAFVDDAALDDLDHGMVALRSQDPVLSSYGPTSVYVDGAGWTAPTLVYPGHSIWGSLRITPDGTGGFWGAWSAHVLQSTLTQPAAARFTGGAWGAPALFEGTADGRLVQALIADPASHRPLVMWASSNSTLLSAEWLGNAWDGVKTMATCRSPLAQGQLIAFAPGVTLSAFQVMDPKATSGVWVNRYH